MYKHICLNCNKTFFNNYKDSKYCSRECMGRSYIKEIIGKTYGKLTVISFDHKKQQYSKNGAKQGSQSFYLCKCECGNTTIVNSANLKNGNTISCGCLKKENINNGLHKTHNKSNTRLYYIWSDIKARCTNNNNSAYKNYGCRGITICKEWLNDFAAFYNWSMNNGYQDDLTIDRIDVNDNYEPSNCRWTTMKEQSNNKRNNHFITYNNETHTITEWEQKLNFKRGTLWARLNRNWSVDKSFNTPIR